MKSWEKRKVKNGRIGFATGVWEDSFERFEYCNCLWTLRGIFSRAQCYSRVFTHFLQNGKTLYKEKNAYLWILVHFASLSRRAGLSRMRRRNAPDWAWKMPRLRRSFGPNSLRTDSQLSEKGSGRKGELYGSRKDSQVLSQVPKPKFSSRSKTAQF